MKETRVEVRIRNNVLWHAIFDMWRSVAAFCLENNFCQGDVGALLNLSQSPFRKKGGYRETCLKIAAVLGHSPEILFPPALYNVQITRFAMEVPMTQLPAALRREMLRLPEPSTPFDEVVRREMKEAALKAVEYLTPREKQILELRYLDELTQEQVGARFGLSRNRVGQIEMTAIRKLKRSGSIRANGG